MRIAIVGAGFCGVACAYFFSKKADVTLFDAGGGASRVSSGLMHPFPGQHCRLSHRAYEGMAATKELIDIAATALGKRVALETGIVRLELEGDLRSLVSDDVEWWSKEQVAEQFPGTHHPGICIKSGVTVYPERYLEGLLLAANVSVERKKIAHLDELASYDRIILAMGAGIESLIKDVPLNYLKGQILTVEALYPLPMSLIGKGYIAATEDTELWHVGSTYERTFATSDPDEKEALGLIMPKLERFFTTEKPLSVRQCRSGIRVVNKHDYRPIVQRHSEKVCVMTGMGSRGLLYHALLAKELTTMVLRSE